MRIARRRFMLVAGAVAGSPLVPAATQSASGAAPERVDLREDEKGNLVFRISGWSERDELAHSRDERWVALGKSCRTAWR